MGRRTSGFFGSRAAGTARPDSELDVVVDLEAGRDLFDLVDLKQALEKRVGAPVDVVTEGALSPCMRGRILATARPL
jgi:predicted nucleotidyltransferase